ncbi:hypothetical protein L8S23_21340 [Enterobacter bugandensis]|uniref:hypothetical protein n=1 Tax=Enterobacter bugandensis TaxID=881260 RepID=UPI002004E938|nr:hypothetical protein [Enterobacter bugandensis]MCK6879723.1 hypothetical protein [Enterobacter bugandensis]
MTGQLKKCIDCDTYLSITAKGCHVCNSTDPFGNRRYDKRMQIVGLLFIATAATIAWALIFFNIIDVESIF